LVFCARPAWRLAPSARPAHDNRRQSSSFAGAKLRALDDPGSYGGDWSGLLWSKTDNGVTTIFASINADNTPEMQITLAGSCQLTANDFIL
jgi:hypothetical protein